MIDTRRLAAELAERLAVVMPETVAVDVTASQIWLAEREGRLTLVDLGYLAFADQSDVRRRLTEALARIAAVLGRATDEPCAFDLELNGDLLRLRFGRSPGGALREVTIEVSPIHLVHLHR